MLNELQIRGQTNRDDWCVVEPTYYCCILSHRISSGSQQSKSAKRIHPAPILTRHRSTAQLPVVGIETSRTESLIEEPTPESNNIAMPRLRIRARHISSFVRLALSLNVCTRNSQTYIYKRKNRRASSALILLIGLRQAKARSYMVIHVERTTTPSLKTGSCTVFDGI